MGGQVNKFRKLHHFVLCDYRAQERIVQSPEFAETWESANGKQQQAMMDLIDKPDPDKLRNIMLEVLQNSALDRRRYDSLRRLASVKGIPYYSRLSKAELIQALSEE